MKIKRRDALRSLPLGILTGLLGYQSHARAQDQEANQITKPDIDYEALYRIAVQAREEINRRDPQTVDGAFVSLPVKDATAASAPSLGSISFVFEKHTNGEWKGIERNLSEGKAEEAIKRLNDLLLRQGSDRLSASPVDIDVEAVPLFADISYQGRTIAESIPVLDDNSLSVATVPYNGAPLDTSQFEFKMYVKDTNCLVADPPPSWCQAGLPIIEMPWIIAQPPALSPLEKEVFTTLNPKDGINAVGNQASICYALCGVAVAYVVATLTLATSGNRHMASSIDQIPTGAVPDDLRAKLKAWSDVVDSEGILKTDMGGLSPHLRDEVLRQQPPAMSARDLLNVRTQLLKSSSDALAK